MWFGEVLFFLFFSTILVSQTVLTAALKKQQQLPHQIDFIFGLDTCVRAKHCRSHK